MLTISASQGAFYTNNGFLELEEVLTPAECLKLLTELNRVKDSLGRDLWRESPLLKSTLFSKKWANLALSLTRRTTLRLAFDQWFPPSFSLPKPEKIEKLFCIQGLILVMFIQLDPLSPKPPKPNELGIFPFPKAQGNILFVKPTLLLNWPKIEHEAGLYCVGFCLPNSIYIQNPLDPAGITLRKFKYGYGDLLRNDTHPLIQA